MDERDKLHFSKRDRLEKHVEHGVGWEANSEKVGQRNGLQ